MAKDTPRHLHHLVPRVGAAFALSLPGLGRKAIATGALWLLGAAMALTTVAQEGNTSAGNPPPSGSTSSASGQQAPKPQEIPAPHPTLVPVPLPDLGHLEGVVQNQLSQLQDKLLALFAKGGEIDTVTLSNAYGQLAHLYHAYHLYEASAACYRNAQSLVPEGFVWPYTLGLLHKDNGKLEQAAAAFEKALELSPTDIRTLIRLGETLTELNRLASAKLYLRRALELDASSAAARAALGQIALSQNDYQAAVEHLEVALRQVPEANRLHHPLGLAYRGLGDLETAKWHLEQRGKVGVRVADPLLDEIQSLREGERLNLLRGKQAFAAGRFADAASAFKKAVEAKPESVRARINLSSALIETGDVEGGVEQLHAALELAPHNPTANYNLGTLLARQGQIEKGISHLERVIQIEPKDAAARTQLADLHRDLDQNEMALKHYRIAVRLEPLSEEARFGEASTLVDLKRFAEARERLDEGLQALPQAELLASALARLLAACPDPSLRDGPRALDLAQKVFSAQSSLASAVTVAQALAELGRCDEAAQWQSKAIDTARQNDEEALASSLAGALEHYQNGPPCRPGLQQVTAQGELEDQSR